MTAQIIYHSINTLDNIISLLLGAVIPISLAKDRLFSYDFIYEGRKGHNKLSPSFIYLDFSEDPKYNRADPINSRITSYRLNQEDLSEVRDGKLIINTREKSPAFKLESAVDFSRFSPNQDKPRLLSLGTNPKGLVIKERITSTIYNPNTAFHREATKLRERVVEEQVK
ncbi:MAG: hypothetical protein Q7S74_01835 [Nanoarchaeota archaeon]|nr:hypothetical protein [Nanoarchaeota archaeon]